MKKLIVLFYILIFLISGFVAAQEDIGVTVGMEVGVGNINKANGGDMWPYIKPTVSYFHSFLDGKVGVYAELDYTFGFVKEPDYEWKKVFPQSLSFDTNVSYNLGLSSTSMLTFYLENNNENIMIAPDIGYDSVQDRIDGVLKPSVQFSQKLEFGGILAKLGSPIYYLKRGYKGDLPIGLSIAFGWKSPFGLAVGAELLVALTPSVFHGYHELAFIASYDSKTVPIYAQLEVKVPNESETKGLTITPKLYYFFRPFNLIASCALDSVGARKWNDEYKEIGFSPALMFNYYF